MSDNRELIWVTKGQAEMFKELNSEVSQNNFVDKLIKERKLDIQNSIENLDDDLLRLKSFGLTYKTELKKVYDEKIYELKNKITQLKPELEKATSQVKEVSNALSGISTYSIERLIDVVYKVNCMSEKDKKLMIDLISLTTDKTL